MSRRSVGTRLGRICLVLLIGSCGGVARADGSPVAEAKMRYRFGTQLFDLGKYLEAAKEYEESFRLSEKPLLLYNIGQSYRLGGERGKAIAAYRGFLRRVATSPYRPDAEKQLADLEQAEAQAEAAAAAQAQAAQAAAAQTAAPPSAPPQPQLSTPPLDYRPMAQQHLGARRAQDAARAQGRRLRRGDG